MANYATLKAAIQNVVKTNGNNEITGSLLQQSLLAMIESLGAGYQYMGIATPTTNPGTPDQNVFYLASTAGTYTNFGGFVLADGEIAILKYNGVWSKDSTGAASLEKVNQLQQKVGDFSEYDEEGFYDIEFSPISGYVWDFAHDAPYESASGSYALVQVSSGQRYKLSGVSISNAIPGAVLYGNNRTIFTRLITGSSPFAFNDQEVLIPEGYDEMIVNGNTSNPIAIKLWSFVPGSAETAIKAVEKKADGKIADIARSGAFLVGKTSEGAGIYVPFPEFFSKNLLNINDQDVMLGYRQYNDTPQQNPSYNLSGYIPVTPTKTYVFSKLGVQSEMVHCAVFNKSRVFLRVVSNSETFTAQDGDAFVRISTRTDGWGTCQFEDGNTSTQYERFGVNFKYPAIGQPEVVMPKKVYITKGVENSIYHENYCNFLTDDFVVSSYRNYAGAGWNFLERCWRTKNTLQTIEIILSNKNPQEEILQLSVQTVMGDPATDNGHINVLCIGDSFTYDGRYLQQIADICPNMNLVGMRKPAQAISDENIRCEGRGGWTLSEYLQPYDDLTLAHMQPFSPFVQANGYNYYGPTPFWAAIVNGTSQYPYGTGGFQDYISWFGTDGYKLNPSVNDLMFDGNNFRYWNGSAWVALATAPAFAFDFTKYINIWHISAPNIVCIFLGKNDFHNGVTNWSNFKQNMDNLIASIKAYNNNVIIGICTPTTADEAKNNSDNANAWLAHMNMWKARKLIIGAYDDTMQNVFLVDTGTTLDPDFGFVFEEQLPFAFYEGNERVLYATNGVHPSGAGYKQIGTCMAGFIQSKR